MLIAMYTLAGCKGTRYIEVPTHDTLFAEHWHTDTTFIDQWHTIEVQGDTIRQTDTRTIYISKYVRDTIREVEQIPQPYPVQVEVEKPLTIWQRVCIMAGKIAMIMCTVGAVCLYLKLR